MNPKWIPLLLIPTLLGWLFLQLGLRKSQIPLKNLLTLIFAPITGFALISLSLFVCYVIQPQQARLVTVLLPWLYILIFMTLLSFWPSGAVQKKPQSCSLKSFLSTCLPQTPFKILQLALCWILTALFIYTLVSFVGRMTNNMTWNPFGGWDTRYFWHLKSRFLFRDPEQWQLFLSETFRWGNHDYPLMVPGIITWGWHFIGREALLWPMLVSLIFVCSLGGLIIWYLAAWCSWLTALIAGIFFFTLPAYIFWGGTMYCDIPYAFFSNSALLLLISALRLKDLRLLALSAFFAGCSAFTKNEGIVFIIWYSLLSAGALGLGKQYSKEAILKNILAMTAGILLPLCVCAYFKIFLVSGQANIIGKDSSPDLIAGLSNGPRNRVIVEGFRLYMADPKNWNGLWLLLLPAMIYWPIARKMTPLHYGGFVFLALLLINLGYALIFAIAPYNIYKHIEMALMRLLLQTGALALVFVFETFGFKKIAPRV